jgi:integrase
MKSGFRTKGEAIKAGNAAFNQYLNSGTVQKTCDMSVADFINDWYRMHESQWKPATKRAYRKQIDNQIIPRLGSYKLTSLNARAIQNFINDLFNAGVNRVSIRNCKSKISSALDWAVTLEYIKSNPAKNTKLPSNRAIPNKESGKKPHIYIDKDMRDRLFAMYPEDHVMHIPYMLGYRAGLRIGEALGLTFSDIDFDKGTIKVNRQLQLFAGSEDVFITEPKYNSNREIKIDSVLLGLLKKKRIEIMQERVKYAEYYSNYYLKDGKLVTEETDTLMDLVCVKENGQFIKPQYVEYWNVKFRKKYGYDVFNYHSLRKTHCTELLSRGANPKDVQKRLGHKNIQVTLQIYTEVTDRMEDKSLRILESL